MYEYVRLCYKKLTHLSLAVLRNYTKKSVKMSTLQINDCLIAVGQLCSTNDKVSNIEHVNKIVSKAVESGAKMVFLPEATDYIAESEEELLKFAETVDGNTVNTFKRLAKDKQVWISVGIHEKCNIDDKKIYNTQLMINDSGDLVGRYRKIHLFDVVIPENNINLQESQTVVRGTKISEPIPTPAGNVGMLTCYDLRFPELSTILRKMEASIITYPSAFTDTTGEAHWESLLRARAIENQCYVIAAAQIGYHNKKRCSHGRSLIVDPWGKIIGELPKYTNDYKGQITTTTAIINKNYINETRLKMPVFNHRRDDIYQIKVDSSNIDISNSDMYFSNKIIPSDTIFYRSKLSFAFTNIRCVVPGHVLICSKRVVPKIYDLTNEEIADLFQTVVFVQKVLEKIHKVHSSTLVVQDGTDAGQTVRHVHCHILPRKPGDFQENDDIYTALAEHDKPDNINHSIRETSEMITEAVDIKMAIHQSHLC